MIAQRLLTATGALDVPNRENEDFVPNWHPRPETRTPV